MNQKERALYDEWKRLEGATAPISTMDSHKFYRPVKEIRIEDVNKIDVIRSQVWNEIRNLLNLTEKFDLGKSLGKSPKEIFS